MRYHLLIAAPNGPLPCGPREGEPPALNSTITETVNDREMVLKVFGHQQLPVVPGGTFKHDELWVLCSIA